MPTTSSNFQSMRASCDRCRFHKLKCTVASEDPSTGTRHCERCVRAKVDCVFSRRARAKRPISPPDSSPGDLDITRLPLPCPSAGTVEDYFSIDSSELNFPEMWGNTATASDGTGQCSDIRMDHQTPYTLMPHSGDHASNQSPQMFDPAMHHLLLNAHVLQSSSMNYHHDDIGAHSPGGSMSSILPADASAINIDGRISSTIMKLSNLVGEIQKTLNILWEQHQGNQGVTSSLGEYPIGSVLHLAKEFTNTVSEIEQSRMLPSSEPSSLDSSRSSPYHQQDHSFVFGQETIDTPTTLLIMSCYISLRRLYYFVFTNFESYLHAGAAGGSMVPHLPQGRELQLGELSSQDDTHSQIYTAVKMLLELLKTAEDILGLPNAIGTVRGSICSGVVMPNVSSDTRRIKSFFHRELALAVLDQSALGDINTMQEGYDGLYVKVQSLKALLMERMDF